jgi:hypothetical protein
MYYVALNVTVGFISSIYPDKTNVVLQRRRIAKNYITRGESAVPDDRCRWKGEIAVAAPGAV